MSSNIKVQKICQHCSKEFTARTTTTQYCSDNCAKRAYKARIRIAKIEATNKETERITVEVLKSKPFLNIAESCKLLGISRRTIYRMLERGELKAGKAGKRTIFRRSDFERLFDNPRPVNPPPKNKTGNKIFDLKDCYKLQEVQSKYKISDSTVHTMIKRYSIPKIKQGWFTYVPKKIVDQMLIPRKVIHLFHAKLVH